MTDKTYETLRILAMLVAPIGAFVATLCNVWNIPYAEPIALTITALDVMFGTIVEVLRNNWKSKHPELYQEEK